MKNTFGMLVYSKDTLFQSCHILVGISFLSLITENVQSPETKTIVTLVSPEQCASQKKMIKNKCHMLFSEGKYAQTLK
jgi:hypothetical protein